MKEQIIVASAIKEFENYIKNDLCNKKNESEINVEIILLLLKLYTSSNKELPIDLLRGLRDISVYAIRNYYDVPLGDSIANVESVMREKYPFYNQLDVLGLDFNKKIEKVINESRVFSQS